MTRSGTLRNWLGRLLGGRGPEPAGGDESAATPPPDAPPAPASGDGPSLDVWARDHTSNSEVFLGQEVSRVTARRSALAGTGLDMSAPVTGLALSGGGIRSATFSLGLLRGLAALGHLHKFDYLSTVSGGSYVGSYYCGLFAPRRKEQPVLSAADFPDPFSPRGSLGRASLDWLRQSGRYLAPSGAGDYWYALGLLVRNWIGLHLVIGTTLMLFFLMSAGFRAFLLAFSWDRYNLVPAEILVVAPLLFFLAIPTSCHVAFGWAFWLTKRDVAGRENRPSVAQIGTVLVMLGGLAGWWWIPVDAGSGWRLARTDMLSLLIALFAMASLVLLLLSLGVAADAASTEERWDARRGWLTKPLLWCAGSFVTILVAAGVDALGFWLYRWSFNYQLGSVVASPLIATVLVPVGRSLVSRLMQGPGPDQPAEADGSTQKPRRSLLPAGLLLKLAAGVAAILLLLAVVSFWSVLAYKATWPLVPAREATQRAQLGPQSVLPTEPGSQWGGICRGKVATAEMPWSGCESRVEGGWKNTRKLWYGWIAGLLFLSVCIAGSPAFLNLSGLTSFYAGRLRRAYLGAGNRLRVDPNASASTQTALDRWESNDDILLTGPTGDGGYYTKGTPAPLHLINVTLNETRGTGSNIVQRDRHGRNLVVSPEGIYYTSDRAGSLSVIPFGDENHEQLPLSTWIAISGAAFSTGLGSRTGFPITQLAGLANVRLGYWWRSRRAGYGAPTQWDLLREFRGDFPGTTGKYWYLSDGGHFENTGAYELLRRRLPFVVISDNGMDERFEYEDVANLVRKVRIDFDCEIDFLGHSALNDLLGAERTPLRRAFGALSQIAGKEPSEPDAVAALARITYGEGRNGPLNDTREGTLVLIKPRLTGDGPADLIRYKAANSAFPQETTIDQFFDEAQWESYFNLGRLIAHAVFTPPPDAASAPAARWWPGSFRPHHGAATP